MSADTSELRKLSADLRAAPARARNRVGQAIRKSALDVETGGKARVRVDTGATKNSIGVDLTVSDGVIAATIGPTTHYAPYLEYGTSRMAPRPFMGPAADAVIPSLEAAIASVGGDIL